MGPAARGRHRARRPGVHRPPLRSAPCLSGVQGLGVRVQGSAQQEWLLGCPCSGCALAEWSVRLRRCGSSRLCRLSWAMVADVPQRQLTEGRRKAVSEVCGVAGEGQLHAGTTAEQLRQPQEIAPRISYARRVAPQGAWYMLSGPADIDLPHQGLVSCLPSCGVFPSIFTLHCQGWSEQVPKLASYRSAGM